jgi:putative ABC transport system permease protein
MWTITVRDLLYRRRQFGIAVVGAALVFALTLILTGMSAGFRAEAGRTVNSVGADAWIVPNGVSGPFTALSVVDPATAAEVVGAQRVDPIVISPATIRRASGLDGVNVIGHVAGGPGAPRPSSGRAPTQVGEVMVDSSVGVGVGHTIVINDRQLTVTGQSHGDTYFGGVPVVYVTLADAQQLAYAGKPFATAFVTQGQPRSLPRGLRVMSNADVKQDLTRVTASARKTIASTRAFMWLVGAVIIGAVTYLSALERVRDFAVLKAVGGSTPALLGSIAIEAILISLLSAAVAVLVAKLLLLLPAFTLPETITWAAYAALPVVAVVVGGVSSAAAIRRAVKVDPALAFG